jgi:hypothetical protein
MSLKQYHYKVKKMKNVKKINNFYEIQLLNLSFTTAKLIDFKGGINTFQILKSNKQINIEDGYFREISISDKHLEAIGFENYRLNGVYVFLASMVFADNQSELALTNFGYIVCHKDELEEKREKYKTLHEKINQYYKTNREIIYDENYKIKDELNSVFNINELFERLEKYNIKVDDKVKILIE